MDWDLCTEREQCELRGASGRLVSRQRTAARAWGSPPIAGKPLCTDGSASHSRSAAQGSSEAPFASATGGRKPSEEKVVDRIPHDEQRCSTFFVIPRRYV